MTDASVNVPKCRDFGTLTDASVNVPKSLHFGNSADASYSPSSQHVLI